MDGPDHRAHSDPAVVREGFSVDRHQRGPKAGARPHGYPGGKDSRDPSFSGSRESAVAAFPLAHRDFCRPPLAGKGSRPIIGSLEAHGERGKKAADCGRRAGTGQSRTAGGGTQGRSLPWVREQGTTGDLLAPGPFFGGALHLDGAVWHDGPRGLVQGPPRGGPSHWSAAGTDSSRHRRPVGRPRECSRSGGTDGKVVIGTQRSGSHGPGRREAVRNGLVS